MTRQHNSSKNLKSIAGGILVGLGLHILSGNLAGDAIQLQHLLGLPTADALGLLPSVALAASQAAQAYDLDQHRFVDSLASAVAIILAAASRHCRNHLVAGHSRG